MKVSIITICYNSAATIEDTIKSVCSQEYPNVEYIIVDGASTDRTLEIADRYRGRIAKVISEKDKGIYDAMNKGIQAATGDVVGILNSDDYYADERVISDVVNALTGSGCDGLYADLIYVNREQKNKVVRRWIAGKYQAGMFLGGWMPPHPTFFVKRHLYHELGLYNLSLRSAADYELMLRFIHRHHISLVYLPRVITHMRTGGQSTVSLRNRIRANKEDRAAWRINDLKPAWYTLTLKPVSKLFQYLR
jgi:glycosyltransferase involved in cell wall biosynthesis